MDFKSKVATALSAPALLLWAGGSYAQTVEAESGATSGSASVYVDQAASGGRGVAYISSPNSGFRLRNVPAASGVDIRYASELSGRLRAPIRSRHRHYGTQRIFSGATKGV